MPVFISLSVDAFRNNAAAVLANDQVYRKYGIRVRRPLRGLEVKEETFAHLKLVRSDGTEINLLNSSAPGGANPLYANFSLQSVSEARMEKHQIVDTFGEPYLYLFGEQPRFLDVSAVLVDSFDFNWHAEWWENYDLYLRGTRSVELNARTYLFYEDNVVEGYMLQAQTQKTSDTPLSVSLSFRLFVTDYYNVSFVNGADGDVYPLRPGVAIPNIELTPQFGLPVNEGTSLTDKIRAAQQSTGAVSGQFGIVASVTGATGINLLSQGPLTAQGTLGGVSDFTGLAANTAGSVTGVVTSIADALGLGAKAALPPGYVRWVPLRGNITDNADEYTASYPINSNPPAATDDKPGSFFANVGNVANKVIVAARNSGALVSNGPNMVRALGVPGTVTNSSTSKPSPFAMTSTSGTYKNGINLGPLTP